MRAISNFTLRSGLQNYTKLKDPVLWDCNNCNRLKLVSSRRLFCQFQIVNTMFHPFKRALKFYKRLYSSLPNLKVTDLDWKYFFNRSNHDEILKNAERRGIEENVSAVIRQITELMGQNSQIDFSLVQQLDSKLVNKVMWLPNKTHPKVYENISDEPILLDEVGVKPVFSYFPATFDSLSKRMNLCRTRFLGHISGKRCYYLKSDLVNLERALIKYTMQYLLKNGFTLVSVPDILSKSVFQKCGMKPEGKHSQVFHIDQSWANDLCLSGTSEMALAAFLANKTFQVENLPLRLCSVSRCYRAEAKRGLTEKGIFRVHAFTKVEMFGITSAETGDESEQLMTEFLNVQKHLFQELGLHFKVLEMPIGDLGLPAYHKVDIEAWMPGRNIYGEISSTSNCTDYQCRRLNIKYVSPSSPESKYCHSVNGTACAIPRMLIAIFENFQNLNGSVNVPAPLQKYLNKSVISEKFPEVFRCMKPTG